MRYSTSKLEFQPIRLKATEAHIYKANTTCNQMVAVFFICLQVHIVSIVGVGRFETFGFAFEVFPILDCGFEAGWFSV